MSTKLTYQELHQHLYYDSGTGIFTRIIANSQSINVGDIAGHKNSLGYIIIKINGIAYKAHRLAWLYVYGYFPEGDIDHRDRIKNHNWILNLREASRSCNVKNSDVRADNVSGVTGVNFVKNGNKWTSHVSINRKKVHLGYRKDFIDSVIDRWEAEKKHKYPDCSTKSTAYLYLKERGLV